MTKSEIQTLTLSRYVLEHGASMPLLAPMAAKLAARMIQERVTFRVEPTAVAGLETWIIRLQ